MMMIGSTARPGVRRGDVSEKPRRWLLIAVLVAVLMPTTRAGCLATQRGVDCDVYGNSQVPSINPSSTYDTIKIHGGELKFGGGSQRLTIQADALKNIKAKAIEIYCIRNITCQPRAFSGVGGELNELKLTRNGKLTILAGAFYGLAQLRILKMKYNDLIIMSRGIFSHLSHLDKLFISHNHLDTIHDESFNGLNQLIYLDLRNNSLKTLTRAMFAPLSHLETLILTHNQIEAITDDIFYYLKKLKSLGLRENRLKRVSRKIFAPLSHLETLDLGENQIQTVTDDTFHDLSQLTFLELDNANLKRVSRLMFMNCPHLEILHLDKTKIEMIDDEAFDQLRQLKSLYLRYNRLKTVNYNMFKHLTCLEGLDLSNNHLETIPDDAFIGLVRLNYLRLINCGLSTLSATLLSRSHILYLFLTDNPLVCDYQLAWVQKYDENTLVEGTCSNPPTASGQPVRSYDVSECSPDDTTNTGIFASFL